MLYDNDSLFESWRSRPTSPRSRPGVRDTPSRPGVRDPRPHVQDLVFETHPCSRHPFLGFETPFVVRDLAFEARVPMFETWCSRHTLFETPFVVQTRCSRPPSRCSRLGVRDIHCSRPGVRDTLHCSRPGVRDHRPDVRDLVFETPRCSRLGVRDTLRCSRPGVRDPKKSVNLCEIYLSHSNFR